MREAFEEHGHKYPQDVRDAIYEQLTNLSSEVASIFADNFNMSTATKELKAGFDALEKIADPEIKKSCLQTLAETYNEREFQYENFGLRFG